MYFVIKNRKLFRSLETGFILQKDKMEGIRTVPRQLPHGVSEEEIKEAIEQTKKEVLGVILV
jgi:lysyl-tRNA synthetase class I